MTGTLAFLAAALIADLIVLFSSAVRVATIIGLYNLGASSEPMAFYLELMPLVLSVILLPFLVWKLLTLLRGGGSKMS